MRYREVDSKIENTNRIHCRQHSHIISTKLFVHGFLLFIFTWQHLWHDVRRIEIYSKRWTRVPFILRCRRWMERETEKLHASTTLTRNLYASIIKKANIEATKPAQFLHNVLLTIYISYFECSINCVLIFSVLSLSFSTDTNSNKKTESRENNENTWAKDCVNFFQ